MPAFFTKKISIGILILASLCIVLGYVFFWDKKDEALATLTNPDVSVHTVTLTENGFEPNEITIRLGDTVIFDTNQDTPFWPASSLHPNHEIYPEFDPLTRIIPPENWQFVFDKAGRWKYHDHINAHRTGVITVLDPEAEAAVSSTDGTDCVPLSGYEKQQCWDNKLESVMKTEGLAAAFEYFVELYKTEPEVPKACHEWGHSLGKASYAEYKETGELILVPETSYCGYGYFHSFIGELVKETGNFDEVLKFCKKVEEELKDELDGVADNCVHGVGHGTTAWLLEAPENWGQFQKTADEGTAVCEKIYTTDRDLQNCYDGVYNELHLDLMNELYGLNFQEFLAKDDPFWICQEQEDRHKRACYFEFVGIFWRIFDMDFNKAINYVVENVEGLEERGPNVVAKIAADWIQFDIVNESQERNIEGCRSIPEFLFDPCMQGLANGFIQHGEPNNLHEKAFAFCTADYLHDEERALCFKHFLGMLQWHYTPEQFALACKEVESQYQINSCVSEI